MEPCGSIFYYSFRANRRAIGHAKCRKLAPRGWRLPKTLANELKPNLFEFLQRVQQCFNKVKGNIVRSQLFCLRNDRGAKRLHFVHYTINYLYTLAF